MKSNWGQHYLRVMALSVMMLFAFTQVSSAQVMQQQYLVKSSDAETLAPQDINTDLVGASLEAFVELTMLKGHAPDSIGSDLTTYLQGLAGAPQDAAWQASKDALISLLGNESALNRLVAVVSQGMTTPEAQLRADIKQYGRNYTPEKQAEVIAQLHGTANLQLLHTLIADWNTETKAVDQFKKTNAKQIEAQDRQTLLNLKQLEDFVAQIEKDIDAIIDNDNAQRLLPKLNDFTIAQTDFVEEVNDDAKKAGKGDLWLDALTKGELFFQLQWSGSGSRMEKSLKKLGLTHLSTEQYRLATFDIWDIAVEMGQRIAHDIVAGKFIEDVITNAGLSKNISDQLNQILGSNRTLVDVEAALLQVGIHTQQPAHAQNIGLGERQMLGLEQAIIALKGQGVADDAIQKIFDNFKIFISINNDTEESMIDVFSSPSKLTGKPFFGLNPNNIVFVHVGHTMGFVPDANGTPIEQPEFIDWGHSFGTSGMIYKQGPLAFTITQAKEKQYLTKSFYQYMKDRGAKYGCVHRINDLILANPNEVLDSQMFNAFLFKKEEKGVNLMYEMMANPTGQKGGMALSEDPKGEWLRLVETLATKDSNGLLDKKISLLAHEAQKINLERATSEKHVTDLEQQAIVYAEAILQALPNLVKNVTAQEYYLVRDAVKSIKSVIDGHAALVATVNSPQFAERSADKRKELRDELAALTQKMENLPVQSLSSDMNKLLSVMAEFEAQPGVPYNRFYGYYEIDSVFGALMNNDFPFSSKFKKGNLSMETPTGDLTWVKGVNGVAVVKSTDEYFQKGVLDDDRYDPKVGAFIHDVKQTSNLLDATKIMDWIDQEFAEAKAAYEAGTPTASQTEAKTVPTVAVPTVTADEAKQMMIDTYEQEMKRALDIDSDNKRALLITDSVAKNLANVLNGTDTEMIETLQAYTKMMYDNVDTVSRPGNISIYVQTDDESVFNQMMDLFGHVKKHELGETDLPSVWAQVLQDQFKPEQIRLFGSSQELTKQMNANFAGAELFFTTVDKDKNPVDFAEIFMLPHVLVPMKDLGAIKYLKGEGNIVVIDTDYLAAAGITAVSETLAEQMRLAIERVVAERAIKIAA